MALEENIHLVKGIKDGYEPVKLKVSLSGTLTAAVTTHANSPRGRELPARCHHAYNIIRDEPFQLFASNLPSFHHPESSPSPSESG